MSMARLLIMEVRTEHRSVSEVARDYRVSRRWVHELLRRFDDEGEAAFERASCAQTESFMRPPLGLCSEDTNRVFMAEYL